MRRFIGSALRAPHIAGPAAAIFIVIAIGAYSYSEEQADKAATQGAHATRAAVAWVRQLTSLLKDAERGQRGYLITGDVRYLEPYHAALPDIATERARTKSVSFADPEGAQRLSELAGTKLDEMAETIQVRESGGAE